MINFENKKVLFIDLDSTLIKTISGKTFPEDCSDFRINLKALNKIKEKLSHLEYLFIVSNQSGISKGYIKLEEFEAKFNSIITFLEYYLPIRFVSGQFCTSKDPKDIYRKPNIGMLQFELDTFGLTISKDKILMIGDASGKEGDFSDSDKKCAENFSIDYIDVRDFLEL